MAHTYREIMNQYEAIRRTRAYLDTRMEAVRALLAGEGPCVVMGSGSSYSVAQSVALMMQLRLGKRAAAVACGDLLLHVQAYRALLSGGVLVVLSRSGETSEAIRAIERARAEGFSFQVLSLTCAEGSTLEGLSAVTLAIPWAFDESVCQTRSVSCLYYAFVYLTAALGGMDARLAGLESFVGHGEAYLARADGAAQALAPLAWDRAVVLGDGELYGVAQEGALAFKEICQLASGDYHVLDVRHGPMVLLDEKTLVVIAVSDAGEPMQRDLVRDVAAKGCTVLVVSPAPFAMEGVHALATDCVADQAVLGLALVGACQLLAYRKAAETGADPDAPDGLDAWISLK